MSNNEDLSADDGLFSMRGRITSNGNLLLTITPKRELSEEEKLMAQKHCLTVATNHLDRKGWLTCELPTKLDDNEPALMAHWGSLIEQKKVVFEHGNRGIMRTKIESVSDFF